LTEWNTTNFQACDQCMSPTHLARLLFARREVHSKGVSAANSETPTTLNFVAIKACGVCIRTWGPYPYYGQPMLNDRITRSCSWVFSRLNTPLYFCSYNADVVFSPSRRHEQWICLWSLLVYLKISILVPGACLRQLHMVWHLFQRSNKEVTNPMWCLPKIPCVGCNKVNIKID